VSRQPTFSSFRALVSRCRAFPVDRVVLSEYAPLCMTAGEGEPIVAVHGLAGSFDLLTPVIPLLAERRQVIAYQLRGEERGARGGYTFRDLADDLVELMDRLGLDRPVVAGLSFGAGVALEAALAYPDRVRALVLQGAAARLRLTFLLRTALEILSALDLPSTSELVNRAFRMLFQRHCDDEEAVEFVVRRCWHTPQPSMVHRLEMVGRFNVQPRLRRLTAPALVVAGDEDIIVDPRRSAKLARRLPDARFRLLTNAGHMAFLTQPDAFADLIASFLDDLPCP